MSLSREDRNVLLLHSRVPTGSYNTEAELVSPPLLHLVMLALLPTACRREFEIQICQLPQAICITFWRLYWK